MAVQAQYPSNILFLNRNVQEGRDYSVQAHPGGYLDQSSALFTNGGSANPRKRGREDAISPDNTSSFMDLYTLQPQPQHQPQPQPQPQLVDLAQLHNQQSANAVSIGLRLSPSDLQIQRLSRRSATPSPSPSPTSSLLSSDFASLIKQQREEIDQFLQAQGEQLRRMLAEKRRRQYRALLVAAEESVARKLREKDAEAEKAARRNAELTARAAQLGAEARAWEAKARAQEAAVASLQAQLEQAQVMMGGGRDRRSENAGEAGPEAQAEDAESVYADPDRAAGSGPGCRACGERVATVVLLPCRHFCVCAECDRVVGACPVCFCMRGSSVEVFLS
ncbi:BOI-related E3 ubiquitin-protein ligase 1 [Syzygium oleosum]|uniref:BOI-related E3 ubiquitin-protein ligase 1 n=1 Tax=Syzygium oleosum TaxID=219896 RepID=UPI0024BAEBB0|nr:BOI-related E3 ubiquitin-protein ligase 1 [Syzygium oleosum]